MCLEEITMKTLQKTCVMFVLLALMLSTRGGIPVHAAPAGPQSAPPAGLSADDWSQIENLLAEALPSQQAYLKASNTETQDFFGAPVAVSGDTVVVGTPYEDSNATGVNGDQNNNLAPSSGAVYVFVRSGTTWSQQAYLKASNAQADDDFGTSVAISGDTVVVGAQGEDSAATGVDGDQGDNFSTGANSGAAYVFTRNGTTWSQQAYLKASNTGISDSFGRSVAVSGDTIVVGADGEDSAATGVDGSQGDNSAIDSGAAYVFTRNSGNWSQQAYLKASNTGAADRFGNSIALSGDTIVVGACNEDSNATGVDGDQNDNSKTYSGAAYVFARRGGTWSQQAYLKASNTDAEDFFGWSVSVSGDLFVVGAYLEDSNATGVNGDQGNNFATNSGAAYAFTLNGDTWSQQAYLKASNTDGGDSFGQSVAVSGNTVVVGAIGEENTAGAAYVFTRSGTTWSQQAYLKASNTETGDYFGISVAVSGDTVAVGAMREDSNAIGVNGDQNDNSAADSGAAYVFTVSPTIVSITLRSTGTQDGWVLETGENTNKGRTLDSTSTTLRLGDDSAKKQYRSILSFATGATLPDNAVITKVTLKVKKQGITGGGNPVTAFQGFMVDIKKGLFGTSALQAADFQTAASKTYGPFTTALAGGWYTIDLTTGKTYINKLATGGGLTQIRLRFRLDDNNNAIANHLSLYSGDAGAASRPKLIIEYYVP